MIKNLTEKRTKQRIYTIRVTDVLYSLETIDDSGLPYDSIWKAEKLYYGIRLRGRRIDQTNIAPLDVILPVPFSGKIETVQIGDLVQVIDGPNIPIPIALGVVYSTTSTWAEAVKNYERPIPPQLESPGSFGELYNYNAIYGTFLPTYEPTSSEHGKWYDRFIKFPVGHFVKDKRSLVSYNSWFKSALENKKKEESDIILNIIENWSCLYRKEKFFYLDRTRMPFRTDPVYDTTSQTHQSIAQDSVIKSKTGIGWFDGRTSKSWTDSFPIPLTQQSIPNIAKKTAYDEIINATLEELRRNKGNIENSELPLEPRVLQEIRIGRNKLVISDVYGDGTSVFITLKNEHDAGISIVYSEYTDCTEVKKDCQTYKESNTEYAFNVAQGGEGSLTIAGVYDAANTTCDNKKISQIRIRGPLGESLLLESYGTSESDSYSRVAARGIGGQYFEMFDDLESGSNYIYSLSTTKDESTKDWTLSRASFFLAGTNPTPAFNRLQHNSILSQFPSISSSNEFVINGAYDEDKISLVANYITASASFTHTYTQFSQGRYYESLIQSSASGISELTDYVHSPGSKISLVADTSSDLYKITNIAGSFIELNGTSANIHTTTLNLNASNINIGQPASAINIKGSTIDIEPATSMTITENNSPTATPKLLEVIGGTAQKTYIKN